MTLCEFGSLSRAHGCTLICNYEANDHYIISGQQTVLNSATNLTLIFVVVGGGILKFDFLGFIFFLQRLKIFSHKCKVTPGGMHSLL